ncbi:MAG: hypothetical protein D6679_13830 [Candidatus Hydrogenedentota bacterium]|nr:MAG: hypothetical protein D6679_13830 [Candidatus Hydrogenedentota bacterium]
MDEVDGSQTLQAAKETTAKGAIFRARSADSPVNRKKVSECNFPLLFFPIPSIPVSKFRLSRSNAAFFL